MKNTYSIALLAFTFLAFTGPSSSANCDEGDDKSAEPSSAKPSLTLENSTPGKATFLVKGMMCRSCEGKIKTTLKKIDGVKSIEFKKGHHAVVTFDEAKVTPNLLIDAINKAEI